MTLQLDVDVMRPKYFRELFNTSAASGFTSSAESGGQRTFVPSCETKEAVAKFGHIVHAGKAFTLPAFPHFEAGNELAQVLVAGSRSAKQRQTRRLGDMPMRKSERGCEPLSQLSNGDLRSNVRADAVLLRRHMKAWRSVKSVAVE